MSATVASPAVAKTVKASDLLKMLGSKPKAAEKKTNVVQTDDVLDQLFADYFEHAEKAKDHKTWADNYRNEIVGRVRPMFYAACQREGKSLSSIKVGKGTMTVVNNYSAIPMTQEETLLAAFGEDDYLRYFRTVTELGLKKSSIESVEVLTHLIESLGVEFFEEHFEKTQSIKVNEALHVALNTDEAVRVKVQPFIDAAIIKPYSPSIKVS